MPHSLGKRPYKCEVDNCGNRFQDKSHVYRHIAVVHKRRIVFVDDNGADESVSGNDQLETREPMPDVKGERRFE